MDVDELPRVTAEADGWTLPPAINEVALMGLQRGRGHGVDVEVRVGGARYTEAHADGVIVATPTGSTAYNLSERGPLVHPAVAGLVVTVMCGADAMPPLVVPPDRDVTVALSGAERAVAASDGRAVEEVTTPAEVRVRRTDPPVRIAGPDLDFFSALGKLS
jgi:NAD+ kinase